MTNRKTDEKDIIITENERRIGRNWDLCKLSNYLLKKGWQKIMINNIIMILVAIKYFREVKLKYRIGAANDFSGIKI